MTILHTERLTLRRPVMDDFEHWAPFAASDRARYIGGPHDLGKAWRAFAHVAGMWDLRGFGSFIFTLRNSDAPLGMAGPWYPADWPERELGWTVWSPQAEGQGYAFEAASRARQHAYEDLGWTSAVSYIDPDNARSIALAERLGATRDDEAARPHPEDLVYRHPAPGALS